MNNSSQNRVARYVCKALTALFALATVFLLVPAVSAQTNGGFEKVNRDKTYKKGTNIEYYKNGKIKSISQYKRKVFWYYTDTYWTIKEYDMDGNQVRLIKKITQMARRENAERVIKEEVYNYEPKKEQKDNIRPE
jgi:hypothetical protein